MATVASTIVQKQDHVTAANAVETTVQDGMVASTALMGRIRSAQGTFVLNNAAVSDVVRLVRLPKGAKIIEGVISHAGSLGTNTQLTIGTLAAGTVTADTSAARFAAAYATTAAARTVFPAAAQVAASGFTVTDPAGAYVTATVTNANTTATDITCYFDVKYVID